MHKGQRHRDSAFAHTDATVRHAFIQLMQLQNEQRQELMAKGAVCQEMPASITTSMPCGRYPPCPKLSMPFERIIMEVSQAEILYTSATGLPADACVPIV